MKKSIIASFLFLCITPSISIRKGCKPVNTQKNFNLRGFVKKRWYVHQQAVTNYLPLERNFCVHADYGIRDKKSFPWRYDVNVDNYAEDVIGQKYGGKLCAAQDKSGDTAKLRVAPCFLPQLFAGPYWVIAYDEEEGYALISGGQPKIETHDGLCKNDEESLNESGLWIFLRSQARNQTVIDKVRNIALEEGFDLAVLNDVNQSNCNVDKTALVL